MWQNEGGIFGAAWIHLGLGARDAALACLSQAVDDRAAEVIYLRADPIYDELRADAALLNCSNASPCPLVNLENLSRLISLQRRAMIPTVWNRICRITVPSPAFRRKRQTHIHFAIPNASA
jgi:hypothetical protein